MASLSLILFDDRQAELWEPFALTRPATELLFGTLRLRDRAERVFGAPCTLILAAQHLAGFEEEGTPPVRGRDAAPCEGDRIFWLSRAIPAWDLQLARGDSPGPLRIGDQVVGWYAPEGSPPPPREFFDDPSAHPPGNGAEPRDVPGQVLRNVWDLLSGNPEQIGSDVRALFPHPPTPELPPGAYHWGEYPLIIGDRAHIEPGCAFDTSEGPIWLDEHSIVRAFSRVCGPAYVGRDSVILGGSIECSSIGPVCRVRGEFATSIALGFANKQHDGHIGHAYLGQWVNLGAETTNSDLKNNYGTIRLKTRHGEVDTGEIKMGSLLGDHVKTGIGLLLNTGTVVGAGSNLYGAAMPPTYVQAFSWGTGAELVEYRLDKFLEVAERAMARRDVPLTDAQRDQLARAWRLGREAAEPA
jgi:UDP-N-acetylglucosamine diphosphorylase / glucose-1-phosphate thymidylyltransferase / UDP-N-acetylgalactosamine diphosphorylase / glucosamine-1-phosphate N-acetyltransferase / galactosamine-1-phosphate N-acetyltransferase